MFIFIEGKSVTCFGYLTQRDILVFVALTQRCTTCRRAVKI